ncbi:SDR family NAD(P)-dependent oxidoreductase [Streptomyces rubradiris]|uniref:SDR family NAD(P)-dependent oxidoreductase n=1 Tax=Streptomyces rubradiris TaxID=285531 RepID=UPI003331B9A0
MGSCVWLVTGASGGLGQALVSEVLSSSERVIAVTRDDEPSQPLAAAFPGRLRTVSVDITDAGTLRLVLDDAITGFGRLDVVVNNVGYALAGPFEELDDTELRAQFEVNFFAAAEVSFFAAANVLRAALPHPARGQSAGRAGCPAAPPSPCTKRRRAPSTPRQGRSATSPVWPRPSSPSPICRALPPRAFPFAATPSPISRRPAATTSTSYAGSRP